VKPYISKAFYNNECYYVEVRYNRFGDEFFMNFGNNEPSMEIITREVNRRLEELRTKADKSEAFKKKFKGAEL